MGEGESSAFCARISGKRSTTYFGQRMLNVRSAVRYVECEDSARVHHEGDDARCDKDGDEERGNGVEACPAVKLD